MSENRGGDRQGSTDRAGVREDSDARTPLSTGDERLRAVLGASEPKSAPLGEGQIVADVYEILEPLGEGGMGIVYLARDRRLARKVALKLIRAEPSSHRVARLVREAQAIAQLTHPNVVTVYQIGTHEHQPFVAMEYVDGGTARTWLAAKPRTWREIVALYLAAGRGLEAAHRAQLVHRDFKPDNVLVGNDGRVRVADFGLVHGVTWSPTSESDEQPAVPATVTRTGAVMGTPAYMAPEQRRGEAVDAAADQFAFAVALWEALARSRPFATTSVTERVEIEPPRRPIPRHLEVALRRALSTEPAARWPSMAPLLAELARDPNARRRRVAYAAGGLLVAGAIVVPLSMRGAEQPTPCNDSAEAIASAWNPGRRAALITALGPRVGALVGQGLDRYASEWAAAHHQACRDTRVTRSQSEDMLDRRMQCLFAARAAIDATANALSTADPEGKARARDAIGRLPSLDRCGDIEALARQETLPTDPDVRRRLDEAARQLADVHVVDFAPKRIDRQELADAALARAREVGWSPLVARALLVHAQQLLFAQRNAEGIAEVREAATLAITNNLTDEAAIAFADLATLLAEQDQNEAADVALLAARAYDDRVGSAMLPVVLAGSAVASRARKHDEAIALARQLVALADEDPTQAIDPMRARHQLAVVLAPAGRFDAAIQAFDEAIAWGTSTYGEDHAEVGRYRALRAHSLTNLGRFVEAIADAEAALAIMERWYGPESVQLTDVLVALADAHSRAGQLESVMPYLDRALICAGHGDNAEKLASIAMHRVIYLIRAGDLEGAAPASDALVAAAEKTGSMTLLDALLTRGYNSRALGRYADAERDFLRGLEVGRSLGEHPGILNMRVELAKTWLVMGRSAEARDLLTPQAEAVVVRADEIDPGIITETHVVLAAALYSLGDKRRARVTIAVADRSAAAHPDRVELRALVDDWHAKHP